MGATLSTTVTLKEHGLLTLPFASVNVYVTVVVPTLNVEPGACERSIVIAPEQLSVAVGSVQVAVAVQPLPALTVISLGHPLTMGFWLSTTVTVKLQTVLWLPAASFTL